LLSDKEIRDLATDRYAITLKQILPEPESLLITEKTPR